MPSDPDAFQTMQDVRAAVDSIDADLVALLAQRFACLRAAARIKPSRSAVRDEARKAQVIANVRAHAAAAKLPPERLAAVWEVLVEQSIAYELGVWDATKGPPPGPTSSDRDNAGHQTDSHRP